MHLHSFLTHTMIIFILLDMLTIKVPASEELKAFHRALERARRQLSNIKDSISLSNVNLLRQRRHVINEMLTNFETEINLADEAEHSRLAGQGVDFNIRYIEQQENKENAIKPKSQSSPHGNQNCDDANSKDERIQHNSMQNVLKNDLSHEADYKLSKIEQDAIENKRANNKMNAQCKIFVIGKRDLPFNAMHEIKLKTSERLMRKGFGAQLPSSSIVNLGQKYWRNNIPGFGQNTNESFKNMNPPYFYNDLNTQSFDDEESKDSDRSIETPMTKGGNRPRKSRRRNDYKNKLKLGSMPIKRTYKKQKLRKSRRRQKRSLQSGKIWESRNSSNTNADKHQSVVANLSLSEKRVVISTTKPLIDLKLNISHPQATLNSSIDHDLQKRSLNNLDGDQDQVMLDFKSLDLPNSDLEQSRDVYSYQLLDSNGETFDKLRESNKPSFDKFSSNLKNFWFPDDTQKRNENEFDEVHKASNDATLRKGLFGDSTKKKNPQKKPQDNEKKVSNEKQILKDEDKKLVLALRDEILNCTSFSKLENFVSAIRANASTKTPKVIKDKIDINIENSEDNDGGGSFIVPNCSGDKKVNCANNLVKLNITINGCVLGNKREKKFFGNGTINVRPAEERERREICERELKCSENSGQGCTQGIKSLESNFDGASQQSLEIVESVFNLIQSHPTLKVLWPVLRRGRQCMFRQKPNQNCLNKQSDNKSKIKNIESLMCQAMHSVQEIIENEVATRVCIPLSPELSLFYNQILETYANNEHYRGRRSTSVGNEILFFDPRCIDGETRIIKKDCTAADFHRHYENFFENDFDSELIRKFESQYTPEYLKLLKASQYFGRV